MRLLGLLPARPRNFPCSGVSLGDVPDFLELDHSWRFGVTNKNHRWNQIWVLSNKHWDLTQMIPEMSSKCRSDPAEHVDVDQSNRNFWKKSPISALLVYIYLHYRLDFSIIYIYIYVYTSIISSSYGEKSIGISPWSPGIGIRLPNQPTGAPAVRALGDLRFLRPKMEEFKGKN